MRPVRVIKIKPQKTREKILPLVMNGSFKNDVELLRNKWGMSNEINPDKIMDNLLWNENFYFDVLLFMKKYKLEKNWEDWVYSYLIYDDETAFNPEGAIILETKNKEFSIRVYNSTNLNEVRKAFKVIKELQGQDKKRLRLSKNLNRDKEILKLSEEGKTIKEISSIMIKKGKEVDYGQVKTIIFRMKNRLKK